MFLVFGPPYIPTLLSFVLPKRYLLTSAPLVLQAYCVYLPVMALNGFLEAFMSSTARPADLAAQSRFMALCSALFVVAAIALSEGAGMRETGMVYANVLNLGARAAYGWSFMKRYFDSEGTEVQEKQVANIETVRQGRRGVLLDGWKCIPPRAVWIVSIITGTLVRVSAVSYGAMTAGIQTKALHVAIGGSLFAGWALVW